MKLRLLLLFFFVFSLSSYSQRVEIDEFVSAVLPGELYVSDTIEDGLHVKEFSSADDDGSFYVLQKTALDHDGKPMDMEELYALYSEVSTEYAVGMKAEYSTTLIDTSIISVSGLKAIKIRIGKDKKKFAETVFMIIDNTCYSFIYINREAFDENKKKAFLNSIAISADSPPQIFERSGEYKTGYAIGSFLALCMFLAFLAGVFFLLRFFYKKIFK